ncbi:glycoside hydrolase family 16 protein [Tissierella sp.]|uniref:glycoside hydrolase family 16 protein n=1 Tax=Tissierella sp. TaxID=41274 RepID=UPI002854BE8E|nr:glycoside hydrolase family 16 protein [Tissierella sp.]MDR7855961.1 glycoside hydrolase family 16 protein [Tissierella sp.]
MFRKYIKTTLISLLLVVILLVLMKEFKNSIQQIRVIDKENQNEEIITKVQKPNIDLPEIFVDETEHIDKDKIESWIAIDREEKYNNELQSYSKDNVFFDKDIIVISSTKENREVEIYTSGLVESTESFKYGRFEFDIVISKGRGIFPAIWLLPINGEALPEIDIFEMIGSEPDIFYGVVHFEENGIQRRDYFVHRVIEKQQYSVALEWEAESLTWYIDEEELYTTSLGVPQEYMYLIINQAIGGNWPGSPDGDTIFPNEFKILSTSIEPVFRKGRNL